ncbi:molybdate ABC transporter substrate-binding protein [Shewanella mangrovi]|uniref:Molybdate ABC transporter substrate-binding protein n=1 Tax=Shewanella mangrovi TaxID=1515746 RepID=A0A094K396_9GAMM|nr:molybdate ABC transporter substrate-binding protein [Shewanella mangrovi]KFZ39181.1 molybdate ABC transporter substrate-binding protein [Shewanella mangrovi]
MTKQKRVLALSVGATLMMGVMQNVTAATENNTAIELRAAGSLKAAMTEIVGDYQAATQQKVSAQFAPSGLLRKRIEAGEKVDIFASANMKHPQALVAANAGEKVTMFARNQLCALAQENVPLTTANFLETILDPDITLGTSTPKSDPAGDYAWTLFAKAEAMKVGAQAALEQKAHKLTGGPSSAKPPKGRNPYGWVMANKKADVFLTYCTNAKLAQKEVPDLQIVQVPQALAVGAKYGLLVLNGASKDTAQLADFILSEKGQTILARYGFQPPEQ